MFNFNRRTKEIISIQIETNCIKFVLGSYSGEFLNVHKLLSVPLDVAIIDNGMPTDESALLNAVESGIRQLNTRVKEVVISLESNEILKREIQIPKVDKADLKDLIKFEVSQYLPIDIDAYVIQHQVISTEFDDDKEKLNLLIVAMPKAMAKFYFDLLTNLKLNPIGMDLAGNNAVKFVKLSMPKKLENKTIALLDIAYANIEMTILDNGLNKFNRLISLGPIDVDERVSKELNIDMGAANKMLMSYLENSLSDLNEAHLAFNRLHQEQLSSIDGVTVSDLNENASKKMLIVNEIIEHFQRVYDEIDKVFKYYIFKERGNKIDNVLLYGDFSKNEDLAKMAQERLNISAKQMAANQFDHVTIGSNKTNINSYISAIGGLIRNQEN